MNECHFELSPLFCVKCGSYSGEEGTCADVVYCPACRRYLVELVGDEIQVAETVATLAEKTPYIGTSEQGFIWDEG